MPAIEPGSVEVRVAAVVENLAMLRTLVAAAAAFEDFDLDVVADLRLAVDEACTTLIGAAVLGSTLVVVLESRPSEFVLHAATTCGDGDPFDRGGFSWHVLSSLVDEVSTSTSAGSSTEHGLVSISLLTRRASLYQ
ncbi:anti-sigma factor [Mycolicibacterium brumae]|uniref:Anti-sigma factor n=1 Tax=Mycolicibacterium brumae TaxID=85968 RepID=A0A2G5PBU2_9MYCO|nr:anti-sigma factor [Mycolicibacterium brumae]PIB75811.1 anti-sigma factor [Mycolicibacterium brumae]UWW09465.1 ATP-binding protein [Mycolicibacterium brumae]